MSMNITKKTNIVRIHEKFRNIKELEYYNSILNATLKRNKVKIIYENK